MIQAMASHSQSQAGGGYAGEGTQPGQAQGLARQGSMYGLTLDEVQNQLLTEPLLSMNLDELLRSVFPDGVDPVAGVGPSEPPSGLHRQGSITMPPELSKKTVDEVWKGIMDSPKRSGDEGGRRRRRERQLTLGEMTLEDFLLKAGVVTEGHLKDSSGLPLPANMDAPGSSVIAAVPPSLCATAQAQWLQQYQQQALQPKHPSMAGSFMAGQLAAQPLAVATGAIMEPIYSDGQMTSPMLSALSDPQTPGRKRGASGVVPDKVVERRQKRMIKNRESAARSRARKQAYTNELENKVSHLEEENERLKRQKELDNLIISAPPPEPKYQLRRTSSSPV